MVRGSNPDRAVAATSACPRRHRNRRRCTQAGGAIAPRDVHVMPAGKKLVRTALYAASFNNPIRPVAPLPSAYRRLQDFVGE